MFYHVTLHGPSSINKPIVFPSVLSIFQYLHTNKLITPLTMTELTPKETTSHFKRDVPKGSKIICKHCGYKIDVKPRKGITERRLKHLNECKEYLCELKETNDEIQDSYFPQPEDINPLDEYDGIKDNIALYIWFMCVFFLYISFTL